MYIINCIYYQYVYDLSNFLFHKDNLYYAVGSHTKLRALPACNASSVKLTPQCQAHHAVAY